MLRLIDVHTHYSKSNSAIEIINGDYTIPNSSTNFYSYGIHPWNIEEVKYQPDKELLIKKLVNKKVIALGEIGLDKAFNTNFELQKNIFIDQVKISLDYNLPIIIHCVRAWNEIIEIRKKMNIKQPWIFHGYNGNLQTAEQIIKHNCYLSFGKDLLSITKRQDVFKELPLENLFLETDDSNEKIELIYKTAARLKNVNELTVTQFIFNNFKAIFGNII